jgi:hypothetical protein
MGEETYTFELDDRATEKNPVETVPQEPNEDGLATERTVSDLDVDHQHRQSYSDGFYNGVIGVSDNDYSAYMYKMYDAKHILDQLEHVESEVAQLRSQVQNIRTGKKAAQHRIFLSEHENDVLNWRLQEEEDQWQALKNRLTDKEEERRLIKPVYGLFVALLYVVVGFVFMAVDFTITRAYLKLFFDGWEPVIMATGISLLAFILKPAVERIFEKPYLQGEKITRNHGLLIVVATVTLVALGMIGYSRTEAVGSQKLMQIEAEADESTGEALWIEEEVENSPAGESSSYSSEQIFEEFITSRFTASIFVLVSIIFAVAGAITMAIGFPVVREHSKRLYLRRQIRRIRKLLDKQFKHVETIRSSIAGNIVAKKTSTHELDGFKETGPLEAEIERWKLYKTELLAALYRAVADREIAQYVEAYARGSKYNLIGELNIKVLGSQFLFGHRIESRNPFGPGRPPGGVNGSYSVQRSSGRSSYPREGYIHQQLRAIIDNNYIKNNAKG